MRRRRFLLGWLWGIWLGCSAFLGLPGGVQPVSQGSGIPLEPGRSVGQTFFCRDRGLQGVTVAIDTSHARTGEVEFALFPGPRDPQPLFVSREALPPGRPFVPQRFSFPLLPDSKHQGYFFRLRNLGGGTLILGAAGADHYLDGAVYVDGEPQERQLTFDLHYDLRTKAGGWAREGSAWLFVLGAAAFLILIPGWALLAFCWPSFSERDWLEKTGLAGGVGLALIPLLPLWAQVAGRPLGRYQAWLPALLGLAALGWKGRRQNPFRRLSSWFRSERIRMDVVLILLVVGLLFLRGLNIRFLPAPLFGDSVQHTVITQLLLDHGGLFEAWTPYSPYRTFTVHYGFSAVAAAFSWLGGWSSPQGVLLAGQVVNFLAVLSLYPLFCALSGDRGWGGAAVILAAGLLSPLPAYYVNWGRYAQLSGQAILPVALWMVWELWRAPREPALTRLPSANAAGLPILLAGLVLGGMTLHYYRMPFFFMALVAALLLVWAIPTWKGDWRRWAGALLSLGLVILVSLLWVSPRLRQLAGSNLAGYVETGMKSVTPWSSVADELRIWTLWPPYVPRSLLLSALLGFALALYRKQRPLAALLLWPLFLVAVIFGRLIHLPGAQMMQTFATLIFLYIPLSLLAGYAVQGLFAGPRWEGRGAGSLLMAGTLVILILFLSGPQRKIPDPGLHALVTRPDLEAMKWIAGNTPPRSLFLVREALVHRGRSVVGLDAGWWIPLLAGRANTVPPEYALLTEKPIDPGYSRDVFKMAAAWERLSPASPEGLDLLRQRGVTHVYLGQRSGRSPGLISFDRLRDHPAFQLVYRQDRVSIFQIRCGPPRKDH